MRLPSMWEDPDISNFTISPIYHTEMYVADKPHPPLGPPQKTQRIATYDYLTTDESQKISVDCGNDPSATKLP